MHTNAQGSGGIYKGVVELVMELRFDAQWEITGPRSGDKSTTKTQVSALAYALQTHSHIHLHASITHVPRRPGLHTHPDAHIQWLVRDTEVLAPVCQSLFVPQPLACV